jgi:hypothetical protein
MSRLIRLFGLLAVATVCLPAGGAAGAVGEPIAVTSTANGGPGTLRAAIEAANSQVGADSVQIEVSGTIGLETALPTITGDVAITGPGADQLTIERAAGAPFRILTFSLSNSSLTGVTIGKGVNPLGAGILNESGSLTLTRVVVSDNEALAEGGAQAVARGGGILSFGPLTVRESVISANGVTAEAGSSQTVAQGGGIEVLGALTIDRSTVSGNAVRAHGEGSQVIAQGGGLQGGELTLTSSTVTGNEIVSDQTATGANLDFSGPTLVGNTIVSGPLGDATSCSGPEGSGGFNLDEDASCGFGKATDLAGVVAGLEPLADNGGPTPTHALRADSPAVDRGNSFGSPTDQRGLPRPSDFATISNSEGGDGSDVGAFELQVPPPTMVAGGPVVVSEVPADRTPPNTRILRGPGRITFLRLAKFSFASTEPQSSFQCKVGNGKWRGCRSPWKRKVSVGKHVFEVRAGDRFGNVDPTPARFGWRVKAPGG